MESIKINLNWAEFVVEFKPYTRWVDREYNNILFKDISADVISWKSEVKINPTALQIAKDYLIKAMTNLTESDIDNLLMEDYELISKKIDDIKSPRKTVKKS